MLQVDWAENGQIILPNEVQSGYFGGRDVYSLHTGYEYSKENSGGFVSLSDENNQLRLSMLQWSQKFKNSPKEAFFLK